VEERNDRSVAGRWKKATKTGIRFADIGKKDTRPIKDLLPTAMQSKLVSN